MKKTKSLLYKYIRYKLKIQSGKIILINTDKEKVRQILKEILNNSPEFYWYEGKIKFETKGAFLCIYPHYVYSKKECVEIDGFIENAVKKYDKNNYVNELHFVREIYKELSGAIIYDTTAVHSQNISSALVYGRSVCRGISKAFQYILQRNGMLCTLVEGTIDNVERHVWNVVEIYGKYYHIDVTLGCDCFASLWKNNNGDVLQNGFFCVSTETIERTHKIQYMPEGVICRQDLIM